MTRSPRAPQGASAGARAGAFSLALVLACAVAAPAQDGDDALARVLAAEQRQVALIERLAPTVAAVFQGEEVGQGGGSGVIIDPEGYVLTNFHVSEVAEVLTVGLNDGRTYRARLLGIDPGGDIALLKLTDDRPFPAVPLGESDSLRPGERVFAMGNPFLLAEDFSPTVTQGVVSGIHRYRDATGGSDLVYGDCIQIDASINPGNSGGPLFGEDGTLLGINGLGGFRPDRGRVNVGVGFAASIDQIKNFLYDLRASQQCYHGTMNATVRDIESYDARDTKLLVDAISKESNAYRAGMRLGDHVRAVDGRGVTTQNELLTIVSRLPAGRRVTVTAEREREDGQGVHELVMTFRLEPLWAGPQQGEWSGDAAMIAQETERVLSAHRATKPSLEWAREEIVTLPDGSTERRVWRLSGRRLRLERGLAGSASAEVYDGQRAWRVTAAGEVEKLEPARRDWLAATAEALYGLSAADGQSGLSSLTFTGGEVLADGRPALELESRDKAGRKRLLYLDPASHDLIGVAYPSADRGWATEEAWSRQADGSFTLRRVAYEQAELQESARGSWTVGKQDAALFERPE